MDKSSAAVSIYGDLLDINEHSCSSRLMVDDSEEQEEPGFSNSKMPVFHSGELNSNFVGYDRAELRQSSQHNSSVSSSSAVLFPMDNDEPFNSNESCGTAAGSYEDEVTPMRAKGKKNNRNTTGSGKKTKISTNQDSNEKGKTSSKIPPVSNVGASKAHNLFASPSSVVRGSSSHPSNISPAGTDASGGHCNCKKSKCLKLYCECFAALRYCNGCNCLECHNNVAHEKERQRAVVVTKERNSQAFQSKVNETHGHTSGCNCKKTQCLKKYCECFEGSVFCGDNCKCLNCENHAGSAKLEDVKRQSLEKKEKCSTNSMLLTTSPHVVMTVNNVSLPKSSLQGSVSQVIHSKAHASLNKLVVQKQPNLNAHENAALATPVGNALYNHTPRKKRNRRHLNDGSDQSMETSDETSRKTARGCNKELLSHALENVSPSDSRSSEQSPSDKHLDMMDISSDSSPELSLLNSNEKNSSGSAFTPHEHAIIEPRYPFFGLHNHRTTKLTALRCLEFLDNKDLYSMSVVNKLWCQAALDDALWE